MDLKKEIKDVKVVKVGSKTKCSAKDKLGKVNLKGQMDKIYKTK